MNPSVIVYAVAAIVGVLFIMFRQDTLILDGLTIIAAVMFIVPGIVNFVTAVRSIKSRELHLAAASGLLVVSAGAVVLGVLMICFPEFFAVYMAVATGILLICCSIFQFVDFVKRIGTLKQVRWFAVVPALVALSGIAVICFYSGGPKPWAWACAGALLIAYGINGFIGMKMLRADKEDDRDLTPIIK